MSAQDLFAILDSFGPREVTRRARCRTALVPHRRRSGKKRIQKFRRRSRRGRSVSFAANERVRGWVQEMRRYLYRRARPNPSRRPERRRCSRQLDPRGPSRRPHLVRGGGARPPRRCPRTFVPACARASSPRSRTPHRPVASCAPLLAEMKCAPLDLQHVERRERQCPIRHDERSAFAHQRTRHEEICARCLRSNDGMTSRQRASSWGVARGDERRRSGASGHAVLISGAAVAARGAPYRGWER